MNKRVIKNKLVRSLMCFCLLTGISVAKADIAIIVNPANGSVKMTRSDLEEIFLGVRKSLPNGALVVPVDQSQSKAIRQVFYQLVAGKTAVQMDTYWGRIVFTGKGVPPKALPDNDAVMQKVASDSSAIGYVDASSAQNSKSVSTVFVIPTKGIY